MSGAVRGRPRSTNSASRLLCSARTPSTKKQPRPTASRITRVWLPGRRRLKHRVPQRKPRRARRAATRPHERERRAVQHQRDARRSRRDTAAPARQRSRLPRRHRHERGGHRRRRPPPAASRSREPLSGRSRDAPPGRPDGRRRRPQQQQRLDAAHVEQRHEREQQRHEQPDGEPLQHGRRRQPVGHAAEATAASERREWHASRAAREPTPSRLPASAEQRHLQHVDRRAPARVGRAEALQDGDAADLLPHEHARHAPHADAAEHDDDEADEAEVVLGALEALADLILGRADTSAR